MAYAIPCTELRKFFAAFGDFVESPQSMHESNLALLIAMYDELKAKQPKTAKTAA